MKGGYTDKYFIDNPSEVNKIGILYYLKIGNMYKIGITVNLKDRVKSLKSLFKTDIEVLDTFEGSLKQVYEIEQKVLNDFKDARVYTQKSTELFKYDILKSSIKNVI